MQNLKYKGRRLTVYTLNIGGMDMTVYDILQTWLQEQACDVLVVQEIHCGLGKESNQWHGNGWNVITSVDPAILHSDGCWVLALDLGPGELD